MTPVVAIIAPGAMGAARRQTADRATACAFSRRLTGRSEATVARARDAGMAAASDAEIAAADFILSILPPGDALALAQRFAPILIGEQRQAGLCRLQRHQSGDGRARRRRDCADRLPVRRCRHHRSAARRGEDAGPRFYASGEAAPRFATLRQCGLDVRVLDGPLSAASALKMSYAGITKGTQAIGAAMMLAAMRGGSAAALFDELSFSQKEMLAQFKRQLPAMPAKAYRWIAEMQEIAGFVGDDPAARELYQGAAHFYQRMAEDFSGDQNAVAALTEFLAKNTDR